MNEGEEIFGFSFPAQKQPAKAVEPSEHSLDLPAFFVSTQSSAILRFRGAPVLLVGRYQFDAEFGDRLRVERVAVVGFVRDQQRRQKFRRSGVKTARQKGGFMGRRTVKGHRQQSKQVMG